MRGHPEVGGTRARLVLGDAELAGVQHLERVDLAHAGGVQGLIERRGVVGDEPDPGLAESAGPGVGLAHGGDDMQAALGVLERGGLVAVVHERPPAHGRVGGVGLDDPAIDRAPH